MKKVIFSKHYWFLMFTIVLTVEGCSKKTNGDFINVKQITGRVVADIGCGYYTVEVLNAPIGTDYQLNWCQLLRNCRAGKDSIVNYQNVVTLTNLELVNLPEGRPLRPKDVISVDLYESQNGSVEECNRACVALTGLFISRKIYCVRLIRVLTTKSENQ